MSTSLIVELAQQISKNVDAIDQYHESTGMKRHSFDIDTPPRYSYPAEIEKARQEVFAATTDLRNLILGPVESLKVRSESYADLVSLHTIYKFGIADSFPVDGEASFKDIAAACGITEHNTRRIVRHGMLQNMFTENRPGFVTHTASTQAMVEDASVKDMLGMSIDELWRAAPRVTDALQGWPVSTELSQTPFAIATGTSAPFFAEMSKHPERARRFANALRQYDSDYLTLRRSLVEAYDWESLGEATIVDVGGFAGGLSIRLAELYPKLRFIITNSSDILAGRRPIDDPKIKERLEFVSANIFGEQPAVAKNADVFYLRWNLHSWPDSYCVKILQALIPSLKPGAKVLLHDFVVTGWDGMTPWEERQMRTIDIHQMIFLNTRERSIQQWHDLFAKADPGFKFKGVAGSKANLEVFEAQWEPLA